AAGCRSGWPVVTGRRRCCTPRTLPCVISGPSLRLNFCDHLQPNRSMRLPSLLSLLTLILLPQVLWPAHAVTDVKAKPSAAATKKPATAAKKPRPPQPVTAPPAVVSATGDGQ